jgi:hypothetical protein
MVVLWRQFHQMTEQVHDYQHSFLVVGLMFVVLFDEWLKIMTLCTVSLAKLQMVIVTHKPNYKVSCKSPHFFIVFCGWNVDLVWFMK